MVRDTLKKWNKNSNWDADLKHGEHHEKEFMKAINHPLAKIEIKAERDWWDKTGNILIEVARDDKPSGIMVTKSTTWVQTFTKEFSFNILTIFGITANNFTNLLISCSIN